MVRGRWWVSVPLAVAVLSVACGDGGFSNPDRSRLKGTASCEFAPPPSADSESGTIPAPRTATLHAGRGSLVVTIAVESLPRHLRSLYRNNGISFEWRIWIYERRSLHLVGVLLWDGLSARPTASELGAPRSFLWTVLMTGNNNRTGAGAAAPCPFGGPAAPDIGVPGAGVAQFP